MLLDFLVLVIVAFFVFVGWKAGLLKTVVSAVSYIAALVIAYVLCDVVAEVLLATPLGQFLCDAVTEKIINTDGATVYSGYLSMASENFALEITGLIMKVIAFIILVVLSRVLIWLLTGILNLFARIPVVQQFNSAGGAIVGALVGVMVVYIVLALLLALMPVITNAFMLNQIESSWITSFMYEKNILIYLIG